MADCMITDCPAEPNPNFVVEVAIPVRPYKELRAACDHHLDALGAIGLRVIDLMPRAAKHG